MKEIKTTADIANATTLMKSLKKSATTATEILKIRLIPSFAATVQV